MIGKVIKYDKKNINTDLIIPARYLIKSDPDYLAEHCMEDLDKDFILRKAQINALILVAGSNFGCGSSREQAPIAIKAAGIKCVIAPSFARIFFRNCINIGLPIIEFKNIDEIDTSDEIEIKFIEGILSNITKNKKYGITKMPPFIKEIIQANGLLNFARNRIH
ncbi:MAG: 3-isopropylmalate dehydratase small subunit [Promethearchaeota archaeon]